MWWFLQKKLLFFCYWLVCGGWLMLKPVLLGSRLLQVGRHKDYSSMWPNTAFIYLFIYLCIYLLCWGSWLAHGLRMWPNAAFIYLFIYLVTSFYIYLCLFCWEVGRHKDYSSMWPTTTPALLLVRIQIGKMSYLSARYLYPPYALPWWPLIEIQWSWVKTVNDRSCLLATTKSLSLW